MFSDPTVRGGLRSDDTARRAGLLDSVPRSEDAPGPRDDADGVHDAVVTVSGVGKCYRHYDRPGDRLRGLFRAERGRRELWALRDVDFLVRRGESWGLIGLNGSGKSTLLKLIAHVTVPTRGTVTVRERVGALLELGAGFHAEYSGRDNAYLAAAMLGFGRHELEERLRAIEEFAELGDAFDRPVRTYSTGMFMRLAFSVATAVDPPILIADEVLAVGDEPFQKRCIRRMERFLADGGTLLFCSHSMYHIRKLCGRALWLEQGTTRGSGRAVDVVGAFEDHVRALEAARDVERAAVPHADSASYSRVVSATISGGSRRATAEFGMGDTIRVAIEVETPDGDADVPVIAVGCVRNDGVAVYGVFTDMDGVEPVRVSARRFQIACELLDVELLPGTYTLRVHVLDAAALRMFDTHELPFVVRGETRELGVCRLRHRWSA